MAWYYVEAGAQKGPFDDDKFLELVMSGAVKADTLVWREGMKDWTPYSVVAGAAPPGQAKPPVAPLAPGEVTCGECGRSVPEADTVELGGRRICASCKPAVAQRMIEGASAGGEAFDPEELLTDLRSRGGYTLDIGSIVSRAWDVVRANFWPCIGVNLLVMVILGATGQVPCLGVIVTLLATGPLMGGLFYYFLMQARGQPATISEAFIGFRKNPGVDLMLAGLIQQLVQGGVVLLMFIPLFLSGFMQGLEGGGAGEPPVMLFVLVPVAVVVVMGVYLIWYPSYVIIADTGLGFWKAMELSRRLVMSRFFTWVLFVLTIMLLGLGGVIALCVGLLVAMPVINSMYAIAWDDIRRQAEEVRQARVGVGA